MTRRRTIPCAVAGLVVSGLAATGAVAARHDRGAALTVAAGPMAPVVADGTGPPPKLLAKVPGFHVVTDLDKGPLAGAAPGALYEQVYRPSGAALSGDVIVVESGPTAILPDGSQTSSNTIDVNGATAHIDSTDGRTVLAWSSSPGASAMITAIGVDRDVAIAVGRGLHPRSPGPGFDAMQLPPGFVLWAQSTVDQPSRHREVDEDFGAERIQIFVHSPFAVDLESDLLDQLIEYRASLAATTIQGQPAVTFTEPRSLVSDERAVWLFQGWFVEVRVINAPSGTLSTVLGAVSPSP
jgi:hypothetical protein